MQEGEVLTVLATDGGAPGDFEAFCRQTGHVFVGIERGRRRVQAGVETQIKAV